MSAGNRIRGTALGLRRRNARLALAVLAILALSLLPLRVLCDLEGADAAQAVGAHHAGGGEEKSDLCCASIGDIALVDSIAPTSPARSGAAPFAAFLVSSLILSAFVAQRPRPAGTSPPSRSYYARSARVLR